MTSVTRIDGDSKMQCPLGNTGMSRDDMNKVAATIKARTGVSLTSVSGDGWLTIVYNMGGLTGSKRANAIDELHGFIVDVVDHKISTLGKTSKRSKIDMTV